MELREYIRIVLRNLWVIVPLILLTVTLTAIFSYSQPSIYESTSRYVTRLDSTLTSVDDTIYGLDTLLGRQRIFVTYCDVMSSNSTVQASMERLSIPQDALDFEQEYSVTCSPVPESNVMVMTVRGTSPTIVRRLNEVIGTIGTSRVNELYSFFPVEVLDPVELELEPVAPNHLFNLVLGGALGLVISISLSLLLDYLRRPQSDFEALSIRDGQLGVYKHSYFQRRLQEEFERAKTSYRTLSIAYIKVVTTEDFDILPEEAQVGLMRRFVLGMQNQQPQANIMAYRGDNVFEILLPEQSASQARTAMRQMVEDLQYKVYQHGSFSAIFDMFISVIESDGENMSLQALQTKGVEVLDSDSVGRNNKVMLVSTVAPAFELGTMIEELDTQQIPPFVLDQLNDDEEAVDVLLETTAPVDEVASPPEVSSTSNTAINAIDKTQRDSLKNKLRTMTNQSEPTSDDRE